MAMCAVLLPALDDEDASIGDIKFEEMDGDTVHVSLLVAAAPLCTSSITVVLRPSEVRLTPSESHLGCVRLRQRPTRGEGAVTLPSASQRIRGAG